jgi:hypothetical protein
MCAGMVLRIHGEVDFLDAEVYFLEMLEHDSNA